jgi:hypothetical protein
MSARSLFAAIAAMFARPEGADALKAPTPIVRTQRERGRFAGSLRGSIKSERGVSRGLNLLAQLSRMGRG